MEATIFSPDNCLELYDTLGCLDYEIYDNPLYQREPIGSFTKYITDHYESVCLQKLSELINRRQVPVGKVSKLVPKPQEIQLDCGHIDKIYFCEMQGSHLIVGKNQVQADIIIEVRLALIDNSRKAVLKQMYRMTAFVEFGNAGLQFSLTSDISIYKPYLLVNSLSEYLVPILDNQNLETCVIEILKLYYPEALKTPCQVSGVLLAKRLGLRIEYRKLSENHSILGQIFFEIDSTPDGIISANTIAVDMDACRQNNKSVNLVIIHECVHYILHPNFFYAQHLYNEQIHYLCFGKRTLFGTGSPLYWVEYQAEQIAYRLQMPSITILKRVNELYALIKNYNNRLSLGEKKEMVIKDTAVSFMVSPRAVKNRLASLGCNDYDGAHNFVNGHFIPAYSYAKGSLKKGETFTIGFQQLFQLCRQDKSFRDKFSDGSFVYAEGHLCRNDSKYLESDGRTLTKYARSNMNECCLVFSRKFDEVKYTYQEGSLKEEAKKVGYYIQYTGQCQAEKAAVAEDPFNAFTRIQTMLDNMPKEFNGTLQYHMDRLGWKAGKLAEECRISERTVLRLLDKPYPNAKIETIIALCIGMKLDPKISHDLIRKSYISMPPTEEYNAYWILVDYMYLAGFDACNDALIQHGYKPLPDCYKAA